ncbi:hypothetical protein ZOSMA_3056G00020, partial [Zostera marina]
EWNLKSDEQTILKSDEQREQRGEWKLPTRIAEPVETSDDKRGEFPTVILHFQPTHSSFPTGRFPISVKPIPHFRQTHLKFLFNV